MLAVLELAPARRSGVKYDGGVYKSERNFLDFVIDGQSLWERVGKTRDFISIFCFEYQREETIKAANRLLLLEKAILPADRRSLFICSECGDIGCGAITALVVREGPSIVWRDFGYENDYEAAKVEEYEAIGPYAFELAQYERTLLQGIESLKP